MRLLHEMDRSQERDQITAAIVSMLSHTHTRTQSPCPGNPECVGQKRCCDPASPPRCLLRPVWDGEEEGHAQDWRVPQQLNTPPHQETSALTQTNPEHISFTCSEARVTV